MLIYLTDVDFSAHWLGLCVLIAVSDSVGAMQLIAALRLAKSVGLLRAVDVGPKLVTGFWLFSSFLRR